MARDLGRCGGGREAKGMGERRRTSCANCMCKVSRVRTEKERERKEKERDSREVIYRKLPRSPHYKHWAIACMRLTSCAAKEHVSPPPLLPSSSSSLAGERSVKEPRTPSYLLLEQRAQSAPSPRKWRVNSSYAAAIDPRESFASDPRLICVTVEQRGKERTDSAGK